MTLKPFNLEEERKKLQEKIDNEKWYNHLWWWIRYGIWNKITDWKLEIPEFFIRGKQGWAKSDTWHFDWYLAKITSEGIRHLKKHKMGIPNEFCQSGKVEDESIAEWDKVLDKIIYAFDLIKQIGDGDREYYLPRMDKDFQKEYKCLTKEEDEKMKEGMQLFIKHYFSLWD